LNTIELLLPAPEKQSAGAKHKKKMAAFPKPVSDLILDFQYNISLPIYPDISGLQVVTPAPAKLALLLRIVQLPNLAKPELLC